MALAFNEVYPRRRNGDGAHLAGTPHVPGAKAAVGRVRQALHHLVSVLLAADYAEMKPIGADALSCEVIDLVDRLGPEERHALRIAIAVLARSSS
jgi:hypothetical protein